MSNRTNLLLCDLAGWAMFGLAAAILVGIALGVISVTPGVFAFVGAVGLAAICGSAEGRYRERVQTERLADAERRLREGARS